MTPSPEKNSSGFSVVELALRWGGDLTGVFLAQSAALATFGLITAAAVRGGAWAPRTRPAG